MRFYGKLMVQFYAKDDLVLFYTEAFIQLAVTYSKRLRMNACPTFTVRNKSKTQMTLTEVEHKDAESKRSLLSTARQYRGGGSAG